MAESEITKRAKRGAELMDRIMPGWHSQIDLDELDMSSCYKCILGQVYGNYPYGTLHVFMDLEHGKDCDREEERNGFTSAVYPATPESQTEYELLGAAWKAEILKRRGAQQ